MPSSDSNRRKVCLVNAYFGQLPPWFPIWVRTCGANTSFDWLLVIDTPLNQLPCLPPNIKAIHIAFSELKALISDRLKMDVCLPSPYKLCDFKIAYGVIFADWLDGYDFWGFCDLDVVWGDLKTFFPDEIFSSYDKIQEAGHLTFCRNVERVNTLYTQPAPHMDYRHVYTAPEYCGLDEWRGAHELTYLRGLSRIWVKGYYDADPLSYRFTDSRAGHHKRQLFYWEDGHLYREFVGREALASASYEYPAISRDEWSYIHLQKRALPAPTFAASTVRGFYITPLGFVQKLKHEHCLADFIRLSPRSRTYKVVPRLKRFARRTMLRVTDLLNC